VSRRAPDGGKRATVVPVRLSDAEAERLAEIGRALEWTASEVMRQALADFWASLDAARRAASAPRGA